MSRVFVAVWRTQNCVLKKRKKGGMKVAERFIKKK